MNMNNMNNMNNNQNNNNKFNNIKIYFRQSSENNNSSGLITIQCSLTEKIKDVIYKYRNQSGDYDKSKVFKINTKEIKDFELTVEQLNIKDSHTIFVISK